MPTTDQLLTAAKAQTIFIATLLEDTPDDTDNIHNANQLAHDLLAVALNLDLWPDFVTVLSDALDAPDGEDSAYGRDAISDAVRALVPDLTGEDPYDPADATA